MIGDIVVAEYEKTISKESANDKLCEVLGDEIGRTLNDEHMPNVEIVKQTKDSITFKVVIAKYQETGRG